MKQFETQMQGPILEKKRKWNWKKISVLAGAGAFLITGTGLTTWAVTKEYLHAKNNVGEINLSKLTYQPMNLDQFNQINEKFYAVKNIYIKKLATEQLLFYLAAPDYQSIWEGIQDNNFNLTPNLSKMLNQKMINAVGSNLRVWGLNVGYSFNPELTNIKIESLELIKDPRDHGKETIQFEANLGYTGSEETFKLKGRLKDSEYKTFPVSEFNYDNLARIFEQANGLFGGMEGADLNRDGYFLGVNFNGEKGPDNKENPKEAFRWKSDQTVNLQEFDTQVWDYVLNSFKNFNLVKDNVFTNALDLFDIDGWNPDNLHFTGDTADKTKIKVNKEKNEVWIGIENEIQGPHTIVGKLKISYKADEKLNFTFTGSYIQNHQWGNY